MTLLSSAHQTQQQLEKEIQKQKQENEEKMQRLMTTADQMLQKRDENLKHTLQLLEQQQTAMKSLDQHNDQLHTQLSSFRSATLSRACRCISVSYSRFVYQLLRHAWMNWKWEVQCHQYQQGLKLAVQQVIEQKAKQLKQNALNDSTASETTNRSTVLTDPESHSQALLSSYAPSSTVNPLVTVSRSLDDSFEISEDLSTNHHYPHEEQWMTQF